jgi:hypothetical protein
MAQKPPAWTRPDQVGQVPLMLSRNIDTSKVVAGSGDAPALAEQIVRSQQVAINRFVALQRQQIELGNKDVHNARLPLDGMDVYYSQVQGLERMHYHIRPEARPPEPKLPVEAPEQVHGQPDFLIIEIPMGLAVEFLDGAN